MCRLLAIIDPRDKETVQTDLLQFGMLAENGAVPPGDNAGHKDGWGIAAYKNGDVVFFEKNPNDASKDGKYQAAIKKVSELNPPLVIGHLRKRARGGISMDDTHPYRFGPYVFCHNGTVRNFETLALEPKYSALRRGTADSEVVFLYLLQTIEKTGDFLAGFLEGVEKMRTMDYTAMNILMSDGKRLIAMREANENNDYVKKNILCDVYYTLLLGKDVANTTKLICSQPLDIQNITWTGIPNHAVFVFNIETKEEKTIRL